MQRQYIVGQHRLGVLHEFLYGHLRHIGIVQTSTFSESLSPKGILRAPLCLLDTLFRCSLLPCLPWAQTWLESVQQSL